jgi:hypothetical protein
MAEKALDLQCLKHLLELLEGACRLHDVMFPEPPLNLTVQRDLTAVGDGEF